MKRQIGGVLVLLLLFLAGPLDAARAFTHAATESALEREEFEQARALLEAGRDDEALMSLRGFVVRFPASPLTEDAHLSLARLFYRRGQLQEARLYLDRLERLASLPEAVLIDGFLRIAAGDLAAGTARLQTLSSADLDPASRLQRLTALASAYAAQGKSLEALSVLLEASRIDPHAAAQSLENVHQIVQRLDEAALSEAAFMFRGTTIGQEVGLDLARRALLAGDNEEALQQVQAVVSDPTPFPSRAEATALLDRLTGAPWLQRAVGVLLPLSGRYEAFGRLVRRGMDLALELHNRSHRPVRLLYRDVGEAPEAAARHVARLANEDRVLALIGPITGAASALAAEQAQHEKVPLLTLSQRPGLPQMGDYVFRNTLTGRLQARNLARYAVQDLGLSAFAVLAPENRLGQEMSRMFAEEVLALNGLVITEETYADDATDFRRQVRLLMGKDPDGPDEPVLSEKEQLEDLFVPDFPAVDFDGLFIPDYADKIALIAPQLPFYGITNTQLLGINGWDSPELVRNAGPYVEGAVFVDGFFRDSPYPFVKEFIGLYVEKFNEEPTILEAQGFDAANLLLGLLDRPDIATREDVRLGLTLVRDYPGVTGATSFDYQGEAQKLLYILQVKNGRIVQAN